MPTHYFSKPALLVLFLFFISSIHSFGQCNTSINLALSRPAVASSLESGAFPASNAFDGNMGTRWSSAFSDPQFIYVDLGAVYPLCQVNLFWEAAYGSAFNIDISNDASTWTTVASITGNTSTTNTIPISGSARYVRMYGISRATGFGYSLYEFQVFGSVAACSSTNLALNQAATASSLENAGFPASNAFDGNMGTRWSSAFSDPQFIYVDLGAVNSLCQVSLFWENAYASAFNIDISNDAATWTTVASITGNTSMNNVFSISGSARYVRMYGISRATSFGYSLYEFQVFGPMILPITLIYFTAKPSDNNHVYLQWATASETNNDHFEIERSLDGILYTTIATLKGVDNSSTDQKYQFTDYEPVIGNNYYRLKQVDLNGHFTWSSVVVAKLSIAKKDLFVYPYPVKDFANIVSPSDESIQSVEMYNIAGARLGEYSNAAGGSTIQVPCSSLAHGLYFIKVRTIKQVKIVKIIK
jgi:hypothetical protein